LPAANRADLAGVALAVTIPVHVMLVSERCIPDLGRSATSNAISLAVLLLAFVLGLQLVARMPRRPALILALPVTAAIAWLVPSLGLTGLGALAVLSLIAFGLGARIGCLEVPIAAHLGAAALGLAVFGGWVVPRFDLQTAHAIACGVDLIVVLPFLFAGVPERSDWSWPGLRTAPLVWLAGLVLGMALRLGGAQEVALLGTPAAFFAWPLLALAATGLGIWLARSQADAQGPPLGAAVAAVLGLLLGQTALPALVRFVDRVEHMRSTGGFDVALALLVATVLIGACCAGLGALIGRQLDSRGASVLWLLGVASALMLPSCMLDDLIARAASQATIEAESEGSRRAQLMLRLLRARATGMHTLPDAAAWDRLQTTAAAHQLILAAPPEPWRHGGVDTFTQERLEVLATRLAPGGLLGLRFKLGDFDEELRSAWLSSLFGVFQHVQLWMPGGEELLLIAAREPIVRTEELVSAKFLLDSPAAKEEALALFGSDDVRAIFLQSAGFAQLSAPVSATPVDPNDAIAFTLAARNEHFHRKGAQRDSTSATLFSGANAEWTRSLFEAFGGDPRAAHILAERYAQHEQRDLAYAAASLGLTLAPGDLTLEGDVLLYTPAAEEVAFRSRASALLDRLPLEINRVAVGFELDEQYERALYLLEDLSRRMPDSATVWANLAVTYHDLGRREDRDAALERARSIDPVDGSVLRTERVFEREDRP
jgi:tetratricopeptide (TPR) repeat protein